LKILHIDLGKEFRGGQRQASILHLGLLDNKIESFFIANKLNSAKFDIYTEQAKAKAKIIEHEAQIHLKEAKHKARVDYEKEIVPLGAPLSRIKLVKLLVSRPVIPTILFFFSQVSKFARAL